MDAGSRLAAVAVSSSHPDRRDPLDLDVVGWHGALHLDDPEPRLDLSQPGGIGGNRRIDSAWRSRSIPRNCSALTFSSSITATCSRVNPRFFSAMMRLSRANWAAS